MLGRGLLGTVGTIARQEGPGALWKGLEAGEVNSSAGLALDVVVTMNSCHYAIKAARLVNHNIVPAGLHRQCLFGGLRIGLYEPVKTFYMGSSPDAVAPFHTKVLQEINLDLAIISLHTSSSSFKHTRTVHVAQQGVK